MQHHSSDGHVCGACRWPFPNPHPSAKQRRAHRKHCGEVEGYPLVGAGPDEGEVSDNDDGSGSSHHRKVHSLGDEVKATDERNLGSANEAEAAMGPVVTGEEQQDAVKSSNNGSPDVNDSGKILELIDRSDRSKIKFSETNSAVEHSGSMSQFVNDANRAKDLLPANTGSDLLGNEINDHIQDSDPSQLYSVKGLAFAESSQFYAETNVVDCSQAASMIVTEEMMNEKDNLAAGPAAIFITEIEFARTDDLNSTVDIRQASQVVTDTLHDASALILEEPEIKSDLTREGKTGFGKKEPLREESSLSAELANSDHDNIEGSIGICHFPSGVDNNESFNFSNSEISKRQGDNFDRVDTDITFTSVDAETPKRQKVQLEVSGLPKNQPEFVFSEQKDDVGIAEAKPHLRHKEKDGFEDHEPLIEKSSLSVDLSTNDIYSFEKITGVCQIPEFVDANESLKFSGMDIFKGQDDSFEPVDTNAIISSARAETSPSEEVQSEANEFEINLPNVMFSEPQIIIDAAKAKSNFTQGKNADLEKQDPLKQHSPLLVELATDGRVEAHQFSELVDANRPFTDSIIEKSKRPHDNSEPVDTDATFTLAEDETSKRQEIQLEVLKNENSQSQVILVEQQNAFDEALTIFLNLKGDKLLEEAERPNIIESNGNPSTADNDGAISDSNEAAVIVGNVREDVAIENMISTLKEAPLEVNICSENLVAPSVLVKTSEEVVSCHILKVKSTEYAKGEVHADFSVDAVEKINSECRSQDVTHGSMKIDSGDLVHCFELEMKKDDCPTGVKSIEEHRNELTLESFKDHGCNDPGKKELMVALAQPCVNEYLITPCDVGTRANEGTEVANNNLESMCHRSIEDDCSEENKRVRPQADSDANAEPTNNSEVDADLQEGIQGEAFHSNSKPVVGGYLVSAIGLEGNDLCTSHSERDSSLIYHNIYDTKDISTIPTVHSDHECAFLNSNSQMEKTTSENSLTGCSPIDSMTALHNQISDPLGSTVNIQPCSQVSQAMKELNEYASGFSSNQPLQEDDVTKTTRDRDTLILPSGDDTIKTQYTAAITAPDASADSISQTDSTECHWGSVSDRVVPPVKALKELQAANLAAGSLVEAGPINFDPEKKSASSEIQPTDPEHDAKGRKKNEELIAKVVKWGSGKPHTPLKNLLVEANNVQGASPGTQCKIVSPSNECRPSPGEGYQPKTRTSAESSEKPLLANTKIPVQKEWNSPARLPTTKSTKGKSRGKPQWVPFMCCSSVN